MRVIDSARLPHIIAVLVLGAARVGCGRARRDTGRVWRAHAKRLSHTAHIYVMPMQCAISFIQEIFLIVVVLVSAGLVWGRRIGVAGRVRSRCRRRRRRWWRRRWRGRRRGRREGHLGFCVFFLTQILVLELLCRLVGRLCKQQICLVVVVGCGDEWRVARGGHWDRSAATCR